MSEVSSKVKEATKDICALMERVQTGFAASMDKMDTHEAYEIADILKDLTEAKKNLVECVYKEHILEAMEQSNYGEDYDENGRVGYRGRGVNGRFVHRSGSGRIAAYTPDYPIMNSGYTPEVVPPVASYAPSDKGQTYDNYRKTRRYYTETHSDEEKHKMKEAIKDNFSNIKAMTVEMWEDLDQAEKDKYRKELMDVMK